MSNILATTYDDAVTITPSDIAAQFSFPAAGFISPTTGTVTVLTSKNRKTAVPCQAGVPIPIAFTQVFATGTTPSTVVALIATPYKGTT